MIVRSYGLRALASLTLLVMAAVLPAKAQSFLTPAPSYPASSNYSDMIYGIAVGDFNGDGHADLVTVLPNAISVLLGNGDGTFGPAARYSVPFYSPKYVLVGDFNGDGHQDIVVATHSRTLSPTDVGIGIFLGKGDGTFQPMLTVSTGFSNYRSPVCFISSSPNNLTGPIAAGDFNNDNKLDLATCNATGDGVDILMGNGDGTFQAPISYSVGAPVYSIAVGDFNRDGNLDIVTANEASDPSYANAISVLLGKGDGTFQTHVDYSAGGDTPGNGILLGDFNNDGILDVAGLGGHLDIWLGDGNGGFQLAPGEYGASYLNYNDMDSSGAALGDFNGDGYLDVAFTASPSFASPWLFVVPGNGDGSFRPYTQAAYAGDYPLWIVAGDFNGDGLPDLAVPDYANVQVFLNTGAGSVVHAPAITSANSATFLLGQAGSFTVTTSGSPHAALSRSGTLPTGVTFTDNGDGTGTLHGTPASGTAGTYSSTFTARNGVNPSATQSFSLTVATSVQAPAITSANSVNFVIGQAGSFTVTASGAPAPSVTESGTLPSGVTFTANGGGSGTLQGTPGAGTAGTYSITFNAQNGVAPNATQAFTLTVTAASCGCTLTGNYLSPITPLLPAVNSPNHKYTVTATIDNEHQLTTFVVKNKAGNTVLGPKSLPITTNWGFSPDDDRFAYDYTTGLNMDNVYVYDLSVSPARLIVSTGGANAGSKLEFSPSGRYFVYTLLVDPHTTNVAIYKVQEVASLNDIVHWNGFSFSVGPGQDGFGTVGWGFSPDKPETSFVYGFTTGQGSVQWTLANLAASGTIGALSFNLTGSPDWWQYSPCGDVIGLVQQNNQTGQNVALYDTSTYHLLGETTVPLFSITLESTASGEQVDYSNQTVLLAHSACAQSNTQPGSNVVVMPLTAAGTSPVKVSFASITTAGETTVTTSSTPPSTPAPGGFEIIGPPNYYYDVSTTATYSGSIALCINYGGIISNSSNIQLSHYVNGSWQNVPTTVNTTTKTACGTVTSLSPFGLFEPSGSTPVSIAATAGTPQTASAGATFAKALQATVTNANGLASGVTVTFTAPAVGPTGTFSGAGVALVTTDASGIATAPPFTANGTAGSYTVTASVDGLATPATFVLTNAKQPLSGSQVSTTASGLAYSRVSQAFVGTVTITNVSGSTLTGPFQILFASLPSGVTLANATGTYNGSPYITVPSTPSLAPGHSATVSVQFNNPSNTKISFSAVIYSGSFN